jgi:4'-phosphopantetheinyl transferase
MDAAAWPLLNHTPSLAPDDVHVWQVSLDDNEARFGVLLAPAERDRAARFKFPRDRRRFTIGRGWLRVILGDYLAVAPDVVPIESTPLGKPFLNGEATDLRFNVAHSDDLALYAITRRREIGVDVERERPDVEWRDLAQRFFAPEEVVALTALDTADQRPGFYRCWTRKEAYVKALGLGMQVPLDGFAVTVTGPAALIHTVHDPAQFSRWVLRELAVDPEFAAALAIEGCSGRLFCGRRAGFP